MRKIVALALAVLLLAVTVSAQTPFVADNAQLLSNAEAEVLENSFSQYHTEYGFTVAAVTAVSLEEKTAAQYASDYYKASGYDNDGVMLLICENEGQWYLYTSGICSSVIPDATAAQIGASLTEDLEAGNYYDALQSFAQACTEKVCEKLNDDAAAAQVTRSENETYILWGLGGGLLVGILVAALLAVFARPARTGKQTRRRTDA